MSAPLAHAKTVTTCDLCGESLTIPPGLIYRGLKGHKQEILDRMKRDRSDQVTAPAVAQVENRLQSVLDVPTS